ncbi:MAG: hypothetical protein Q9223_007409, partial [Gallowayella weberi]
MNPTGFAAQHISGQPITPEMQERYQRDRAHQMQIRQQQIHAQQQQNMANSMSPNHGMSPMHMNPHTPNLQHLAAQNQGLNQQTIRAYQTQQQDFIHRQMNGGGMPNPMMASATPNPHGRAMPPQPPHPGAGGSLTPQQQRLQQQQHATARIQYTYQNNIYNNYMKQLIQQYGSEATIPPEQVQAARQRAAMAARNAVVQKQNQMRQQQHQQQQQMMAAQMAGGMGGGM